ncbi:ABC transporter permease [Parafilimonas sp.]|uniref:ABC transporter permease n=1 Tax=Parafilimonas sp. TaxID=1969739 RepID=UPI0039E4BC56
MLRNYFKTAFRNIVRHKAFAVINIAGLAIGMACSIFILLWVQNEKSYDRFLANADEIYRVTAILSGMDAAVVPPVMMPELKEKLPAVKNMARVSYPEKRVIEFGTKKFLEEGALYVDSTFLQMFSFPLVEGSRATALLRPDAILITKDMAKKYFGNEDAMGKTLRINNDRNVTVTGVLENLPENSHFQFSFLMPLSAIAQTDGDLKSGTWDNFSFYGYLQLDKNFNPSPAALAGLENKINKIYKEHAAVSDMAPTADFHLQPLTDIHLGAAYLGDFAGHGNALYVKIFFIVAIFILGVACINFMNLATARSARRAKEVGLRKTIGAGRWQLIIQFLSESLCISFLSLCIAVLLVWLLLPVFNSLTGKHIAVHFLNWKLILMLSGIALVTGLLSGSYPALFLSSFKPVKVLKGEVKRMTGANILRNGLVILQFTASIILLVGTIVVYQQLRFIKNMNLGFEKSNLIYMPMMGDLYNRKDAVKLELQKNRLTNDFTITGGELPTNLLQASDAVSWDGKDPNKSTIFNNMAVDDAFFDVFGMKIINGRSFFKDSKADSNNYIINEKAAKIMGMTAENAVGKTITFGGIKGDIIGVAKDFNFKPVQQAIEPLIMRYNQAAGMVVVRTRPVTTEAAIKALEKISTTLNPSTPFTFGFIDEDLNNLYKGEQQMGRLFNIFTILALFISCLGLYGLSAFLAEQRTKEIGVRKVLGASVFNVVYLLSSSFTKLILIAVVIAVPLSWLAVNKWLNGFAYRIEVSWIVFFIATALSLLVAWITIGYESIKAASANPVKSLRTE